MRYLLTLALALLTPQSPNTFPALGIVDFYGLRTVPEQRVLEVLPYHLGDTIRVDQFKLKKLDAERELESISKGSQCKPNPGVLCSWRRERR